MHAAQSNTLKRIPYIACHIVHIYVSALCTLLRTTDSKSKQIYRINAICINKFKKNNLCCMYSRLINRTVCFAMFWRHLEQISSIENTILQLTDSLFSFSLVLSWSSGLCNQNPFLRSVFRSILRILFIISFV